MAKGGVAPRGLRGAPFGQKEGGTRHPRHHLLNVMTSTLSVWRDLLIETKGGVLPCPLNPNVYAPPSPKKPGHNDSGKQKHQLALSLQHSNT